MVEPNHLGHGHRTKDASGPSIDNQGMIGGDY